MPFLIPLITPISTKYFMKATSSNEPYYKAVDLRLCLEKIADTMVFEFLPEDAKEGFKKLSLHNKLLKAKLFMPKEIIDQLIKVKSIGNEGAHEGEEVNRAEEYIETEQTPLVVEKLSMAYLKNGLDREAFQVLKKYHELRIIDDYFFSAMNEKLKILKLQMNKLPIAQNLQMSSVNFKQLLAEIPEEKQNDFILLMSLILTEHK